MIPQVKISLGVTHVGGGGVAAITLEDQDEALDWDKTKMVLERDERGHSLVEMLVAPFSFVGPGYDFLKDCDNQDGPDAEISIVVRVKFDPAVGYEILHVGMMKMSALTDMTDNGGVYYKLVIPVLANDLWSKFIAAFDKPVDVLSPKDIYGVDVDVIDPKTLRMTPQKIQQQYEGHVSNAITWGTVIPDGEYASIDFSDVRRNEIEQMYTLEEFLESGGLPPWKFAFKYGGDYLVASDLYFYQGAFIGSSSLDNGIKVFIKINDDPPVPFIKTDEIGGIDEWSHYSLFNNFLSVPAGSRFRIYMLNDSGAPQAVNWYAGVIKDSYLKVIGATTFSETDVPAILIHDVGYAIIDRIVGQGTYHKFLSPVFGHTDYTAVAYDDVGCEFMYMLLLGVHARGKSMIDKNFFQAFGKYFQSANACFNLGYGIRIIDDKEYIVIDKKETFYNNDKSINFVGVGPIKRNYDESTLYDKIEYGYKGGAVESESGSNDPQVGTHTRITRFERVGTPINITSDFIAAGGAIEQARRQQLKPEQDYRLDKETLIIAINKTEVDPDIFKPELDEDFSLVLGVPYSDIYNIRLANVFNFLRWINVFKGGLIKYPGSFFKFQEGSGNYGFAATMDPASECLLVDETLIAQNDNISKDIDTVRKAPLHKSELLTFVTAVSWDQYKTIRNNRDKAIGVSSASVEGTFDRTFDFTFHGEDTAYPCHIKRLDWWLKRAEGDFTVWPAIVE